MAYQNPQNPDALPWFAEPERKGSQASPAPPQKEYRKPTPQQQQQQQQQQYNRPPPQQQYGHSPTQQQQYNQPPPQQQYNHPPPQQYQRSHSPNIPPRDHYGPGGSGGGGRVGGGGGGLPVGLPSGPRPGANNNTMPPPRSPVPPQMMTTSPTTTQHQHPQQQQQRPPPQHPAQHLQPQRSPTLVYQGEEELTTEQLRDIFNGLDANRVGKITEKQLAQNLINSDRTKFDQYTVNMMVRMFDSDRSGDLNFSEFVGLWQFLDRWRTIFNRFDTDRSGNINMAEFKNTLVSFQYRLSDSFVEFLFRNYDRENKGVITFDLFMQSCITLKRMTDTFKKYDDDRDGYITINFEDFVSEFLRQMKRVMIVDESRAAHASSFY